MKKKHLFLSSASKIEVLEISKIYLLEGDNNYTKIHLKEKTYLCSKTLKSFEALLSKKFIRISKRYIVNFNKVSYYGKKDKYLKLKNNKEVLVPNSKVSFIYSIFKD